MLRKSPKPSWSLLLLMWLLAASSAFGQGTAFTYQGKLTDGSSPANGTYDFEFKLYDTAALGTGTQFGTTQTLTSVAVSSGIFTVQLDFGACPACFNGAARFLEISVRPTRGGSFTTLGPRQPFTSAPYALRSQSAAAADGLSVACVNCITSSQIGSVDGSAVTGTIPVGSVPPGSGSYIQNTTTQQAASNFNISGSGVLGGTLSANSIDATTEFNIGGSRVLSVTGSDNLFAGVGAGSSNTIGGSNSFFGQQAGFSNTTGSYNSLLGKYAGRGNTSGQGNTFAGLEAGFSNTTGSENAFFGTFAGWSNTIGNYNTMVGRGANVGAGDLSNATAVGSNALVGCSNCLVLGSINGVGGATADTNIGIGTTAPTAKLHVANGSIRFSNSLLKTDQGGSIELGGTESIAGSGTPYIDFHFNGLIQDYNVRLMNDQNGRLALAGKLYVHGNEPNSFNAAVFGDNTFSGNGVGYGIHGRSVDPGGGIGGYFEGSYIGVDGRVAVNSTPTSPVSVYGVVGEVTGDGPIRYGVLASVSSFFADETYGVYASSTVRNTANTSYGIYASAQGAATNWAGYFVGNVNVNGTLSKSAGSFKIDHPVDPANKYLLHSFVESPDMMNVYNGNIITDANGDATVTLPDWFEALNKDFRYQLTVIGQFAQAIISEKIKENKFKIKTDTSGVEVSWQVTGIRKDKFAEDNRIKVEEEKSPKEKGKCLYAPLCNGAKIVSGADALKEEELKKKQ